MDAEITEAEADVRSQGVTRMDNNQISILKSPDNRIIDERCRYCATPVKLCVECPIMNKVIDGAKVTDISNKEMDDIEVFRSTHV